MSVALVSSVIARHASEGLLHCPLKPGERWQVGGHPKPCHSSRAAGALTGIPRGVRGMFLPPSFLLFSSLPLWVLSATHCAAWPSPLSLPCTPPLPAQLALLPGRLLLQSGSPCCTEYRVVCVYVSVFCKDNGTACLEGWGFTTCEKPGSAPSRGWASEMGVDPEFLEERWLGQT